MHTSTLPALAASEFPLRIRFSIIVRRDCVTCLQSMRFFRSAPAGLSRLPLVLFLRSIQPALQHCLVLRSHFQKPQARAHIRLGINDLRLGLEERLPRGNFHQYHRPLGKGIHHVQIASVPAQFAHSRSDPDVCSLFDQLSAGDERVSRRTASLLVVDGRLQLDVSIPILRRFPQSAEARLKAAVTNLQRPRPCLLSQSPVHPPNS